MHRSDGHCVLVRLRYNFHLCPTPGQRVAPAKAFGCARRLDEVSAAVRAARRDRDRVAQRSLVPHDLLLLAKPRLT
ncbi:helix-turn-helix domain-containing protein [Microtetraspora fusca]|uniref:helix-turn-helix domain-containing protein n=1 Tax=Microtetraspora fusca TaxID=1997 RepID=UPI003571395C